MKRILRTLCLWGALPLTATDLAVVRTSGQFDADGSVLYSVYVATASQRLGEVAIGATVPLGTRFLENLDVPAGAVFEGVRDNSVVWRIKEIPADRLIGPFTFRTKPDGAAPVIAEPSAAISFAEPEKGLIVYDGKDTVLTPWELSGTVFFDHRGTLNDRGENAPVPLGKTGILFFAPAGAVTVATSVTVEREAINESRLPKTANPLWWCGLHRIVVSPGTPAAKDFGFAFPSRRPLTPGLALAVTGNADGAWSQPKSDGSRAAAAGEPRRFPFGGFNNFGCSASFGFNTCFGSFGGFGGSQFGGGFGPGFSQFGIGVGTAERARATTSASELTAAYGTPTTPTTAITDGTSNTIIAILIGHR